MIGGVCSRQESARNRTFNFDGLDSWKFSSGKPSFEEHSGFSMNGTSKISTTLRYKAIVSTQESKGFLNWWIKNLESGCFPLANNHHLKRFEELLSFENLPPLVEANDDLFQKSYFASLQNIQTER